MALKLLPLAYPLRSLRVRWTSSLYSAIGIALSVAVFSAILSLRVGFQEAFSETGRDDVAIYLRPGATSEGESGIRKEQVELLRKSRPEIASDAEGVPLAAGESYLALNLERLDGGTTNVPIRGIEPASLKIHGKDLTIVEGRPIWFGADEVMVGRPLGSRIKNCRLGDTLQINYGLFRVVGIFDHGGAYTSEIWADADRLAGAIKREVRQRVMAQMKPGVSIEAVATELESDKQTPMKVLGERAYFASQTGALGGTLLVLGLLIGGIMGIAAMLGATNTMLASVGSRTREVGILLSLGFGRLAIFLSFLLESALIGLSGAVVGLLLVVPLNGIETGTTNFQTFTEASFAFRITPGLLLDATIFAVVLGLIGGAAPAWKAARLLPTQALRRQ
jgi:putative ABC transport system permease protein